MTNRTAHALAAALLLSACGGSLVDHLGFVSILPDGGTGGGGDGGNSSGCLGTVDSCGTTTCSACPGAPLGQTAACQDNACVSVCNAPTLACDTGCCLPSQIAAGGNTTCAVLDLNTVRCWGQQLGSASSSAAPVKVEGLSGVSKIAVGPSHACAIMSGGVRCWGDNSAGQLGQTSPAASASALDAVPGVSDVADIAVGSQHSCAVNSSGTVFCWGDNSSGQLGDLGAHSGVVTVAGVSGASAITAGLLHTCAQTGTTATCWGSNLNGRLGNPNPSGPAPRTVAFNHGGSPNVTALAAGGSHGCAVNDANIDCWGQNSFGQLGDGTIADAATTVRATLFAPVSIWAGGSHTCATSRGGTPAPTDDDPPVVAGLYCWGANAFGQLGSGTPGLRVVSPPTTPVSFGADASQVFEVAAGAAHTCARLADSQVFCWGSNSEHQVSPSSAAAVLSPTPFSSAVPR